ncbi:MAG: hypothetical protein II747_04280 [Clostridia bacterium]|nr:hypothetical protein [Clostridia bacterium]
MDRNDAVGIILIVLSTIVFSIINAKIIKSRKYRHDIIGYIIGGWEVIGLYFAAMMLGIVLILK